MEKKKRSLATIILLAMVFGIALGIFLNQWQDAPFVKNVLIDNVFKLFAVGFTNLIKMIVVPIVFFSLIMGASDMGDVARLGRVGGKTLIIYLVTTTVAIVIGITLALTIQPGGNFDMTSYAAAIEDANVTGATAPPFVEVILDIIPQNPFRSLIEGDMLQVIFAALMIGTALTILGDKTKELRNNFQQMYQVVLKIVMIVMAAAPVGVFFLTVDTFTRLGFSAFGPLAIYMATVIIALLIHFVVVYGFLLTAVLKLNPLQFLKNFAPALAVSFSTASSNATLPITLDSVTHRCGVHTDISSFSVPLGATVNMDGSAISIVVQAVFLSQAYGIELGIGALAMIVITATLASIGTAGVPGSSLILLSAILLQIGVPVQAVGILIAVDRILSMTRTSVNVSGDAIVSMIVAKTEGLFSLEIFNKDNAEIESVKTAV